MERRYNTEIRELPVAAGLCLRAEEDGGEARTIEGMAIVFGRESQPLYSDEEMEIRERISPAAVTRELLDSSDILCTLYHDDRRILARSRTGAGTLRYDVTAEGVRFRFDAADTEDGRTALELVKRGEIDGCSFCYVINVADPSAQTREVRTEGGRRIVTYTVNKIETIRDFTLTPRPAYRDTEVGTRLRDAERARDEARDEALIEADLRLVESLIINH